MITEILCLDKNNCYVIFERLDGRSKCAWDCSQTAEGFQGTEDELIRHLQKNKYTVRGVCSGGKLRTTLAPKEE